MRYLSPLLDTTVKNETALIFGRLAPIGFVIFTASDQAIIPESVLVGLNVRKDNGKEIGELR